MKEEWKWAEEQHQAIVKLKEALISPPVLAYPKLGKPWILLVDGSSKGLGAVLVQKSDEGLLRPIGYANRGLNIHEGNYSVSELEALAVIFGLRKFDSYFHGGKIFVMTDHNALTFLMRQRNTAGRLHR